MKNAAQKVLVSTIRERCRMCYMCVRECPAKAIRIAEGQAEVMAQRCVACGNCVRVCTQHAKHMYDSRAEVAGLLTSSHRVAAMVAPSFPAEFAECSPDALVGMVRGLGFDLVTEVAFGADLVADRYRELVGRADGRRYIATTCPAIVAFVERYHPELASSLAPVVSPMIAMARALKRLHGDELKIVFIGPCIAKKGEAMSEHLDGDVDAVLTFIELRDMLAARGLTPTTVDPTDFDPPHGGIGGLFAISRGLLQAAHIEEDLVDGRVVAAEGRSNFVDAIAEFGAEHLGAKLLEVLACNGCINGPGIGNPASSFSKRNSVSRYVRERTSRFDWHQWRSDMAAQADLSLLRSYSTDDQRIPPPSEDELKAILVRLGKPEVKDELNCGACGYETCRDHAIAIYKGLAEDEMCLPYTIDKLQTTMRDLASSNDELEETREALINSEKLASMGQLAAGIAHELNNPLGVVLMYSHLLRDEREGDGKLQEDLDMITEQADRCKKIVAGLLHFARQNKVDLAMTDARDLVERTLRACPTPENVEVVRLDEAEDPMVKADRDQMLQVLTNLVGNAYAAMPDGGKLTVRTCNTEHQLKIRISDTGVGIPVKIREKIFEPFFTTKDVGKGTGLGLAVTYGIVKMHRGNIRVESNDDPDAGPTGTAFEVSLPR